MEILRDYSQIVNKTKEALSLDITEIPFLDPMDDEELYGLAQHTKVTNDSQKICVLSELIFQLNEYVPAVCNYIKIFLYTKSYDAVYYFLSKMFAAHFGSCVYSSKQDGLSYEERYFDRFIEVVKTSNIELENYLPLVLDSISKENLKIHMWEKPATEYMQNLIRENVDEVSDYVLSNNEYELEFIKLILEFNTQNGIALLFDEKIENHISSEDVNCLLKQYITDTLNYFDRNISLSNQNRFHLIKVLSSIKNNQEVETRLKDIFSNETDAKIKEYLSNLLCIGETTCFGSEKHFRVMARKKVEVVQERSLMCAFNNLPLKFIDLVEAEDIDKTYLINIFKEEKNLQNLYGLIGVKDIFVEDDLNNFVSTLFEKLTKKDDINCAKWLVRMSSLLSSGIFERTMYEFLIGLYKTARKKEAYYMTECLIYSKKQNFLEVFARLKGVELFEQRKNYFIELYSKQTSLPLSYIKDLLVPTVLSTKELEEEKERLYNEFIAGRNYSYETFKKLFIYQPIFNQFAQNLIFGEYKQNKLYSIFKVIGNKIEYIYGEKLSDEDGVKPYISLVHSLDLDERFAKVYIDKENLLFNQFPKFNFDVKNFPATSICVQNLEGMLVNGINFISKMKSLKFSLNINEGDTLVSSLVQKMENINLLAELEFEKPISVNSQTATLGQIRFYRLNGVMKDKDAFITNKSNAISVGTLPERYFEYILDGIYNSIQN